MHIQMKMRKVDDRFTIMSCDLYVLPTFPGAAVRRRRKNCVTRAKMPCEAVRDKSQGFKGDVPFVTRRHPHAPRGARWSVALGSSSCPPKARAPVGGRSGKPRCRGYRRPASQTSSQTSLKMRGSGHERWSPADFPSLSRTFLSIRLRQTGRGAKKSPLEGLPEHRKGLGIL